MATKSGDMPSRDLINSAMNKIHILYDATTINMDIILSFIFNVYLNYYRSLFGSLVGVNTAKVR